jgi:hypothetical protein
MSVGTPPAAKIALQSDLQLFGVSSTIFTIAPTFYFTKSAAIKFT